MANHTNNLPLPSLDPQHIFCERGLTLLTCKECAGHASRQSSQDCQRCEGKGITVHFCARCDPEAFIATQGRALTSAMQVRACDAATYTRRHGGGGGAPGSMGSRVER